MFIKINGELINMNNVETVRDIETGIHIVFRSGNAKKYDNVKTATIAQLVSKGK